MEPTQVRLTIPDSVDLTRLMGPADSLLRRIEGAFDAIIINPPIRAGKAVIYGLFSDARRYLKPDGALYIVIRKQQGAPSALKYLREIYAEAEVIDRGSGFHVIRARGAKGE